MAGQFLKARCASYTHEASRSLQRSTEPLFTIRYASVVPTLSMKRADFMDIVMILRLLSMKRADFVDIARILRPLSIKRADFVDGK